MKFQSLFIIFIIFNIFLISFSVFLGIFPMFLMDSHQFSYFWSSNWYLFIIILIIITVFDFYFLLNRKLYLLLEKEDWPALVHYLENRILRKGKYSPRLVRILANTYLVLSDSAGVISLENRANLANSSLVNNNALLFGTARILGKDIPGAVRFFESKLGKGKKAQHQWISWYYGFALLLNKQYEKASREFSSLASSGKDGIICGLSAYFLDNSISKSLPAHKQVLKATAMEGRDRVLKAFPKHKNWIKETQEIKGEIYTVVLSKYMDETAAWLYATG